MNVANINNLNLVRVAMEGLMERPESMPGLGVFYGPSGFGKTTTTAAIAIETRAYYVQMRSAWSKKCQWSLKSAPLWAPKSAPL